MAGCDDQIFYTVDDPLCQYRCRIRELVGRRIRACFHGWVILSNHPHNIEWSLWNPVTSELIRLPRLILKDGDSDDIVGCCLTSPPDDPASILLLTREKNWSFVFCRLDHRKRWTEMSYAKQLTTITGLDDGLLRGPICCNGKVFAYACIGYAENRVLRVEIVVKEKDVAIRLVSFLEIPGDGALYPGANNWYTVLKEFCGEVLAIDVGFSEDRKPIDANLYRLDTSSMEWEEVDDLRGVVFFVDTPRAVDSEVIVGVDYSPAIASKSGGGYVHILHETGIGMYSYHVKDKTISLDRLDLPPRSGALQTSHISVWSMPEFRLQDDHRDEADCKADSKEDECKEDEMVVRAATNEEQIEARLLNIPFHVLEMMMEYCLGVEYLNFRTTCKLCWSAAPPIRMSSGKQRTRSQTYSTVSPWLVVFDKYRDVITFTDPMFGDKYIIKAASPGLFYYNRVLCSKYGWLLLYIGYCQLTFFNPFTGDIRELPRVPVLQSCIFSAPPTSPDCMVVGFTPYLEWQVYIHFIAREPASWHRLTFDSNFDSLSFRFPTFCGRDVYTLFNEGRVDAFREIGDDINFSCETIVEVGPTSCCEDSREYFLVKCDEHDVFVVVVVGEFGGSVEVWKLKGEKEWEKVEDLGRHVIYIYGGTCICMDARIPEMENKIYFPRLHSGNGKIVFYSIETRRYHTFDGRDVGESFEDFFGTKHLVNPHTWIEPSWC